MCPGEVDLENWKMSLTWSRVKFRLQNRLTGFLLPTVVRGLVGIPLRLLGFAASVGHLSTLKTQGPFRLRVGTLVGKRKKFRSHSVGESVSRIIPQTLRQSLHSSQASLS